VPVRGRNAAGRTDACWPSLLFLGGRGAEQEPADERQPQGSDRGVGQELPQPEEDQQ
jgi:hypothetical protein